MEHNKIYRGQLILLKAIYIFHVNGVPHTKLVSSNGFERKVDENCNIHITYQIV